MSEKHERIDAAVAKVQAAAKAAHGEWRPAELAMALFDVAAGMAELAAAIGDNAKEQAAGDEGKDRCGSPSAGA